MTTREALIVAALGAGFAVVCVGWFQLFLITLPVIGTVPANLMFGVWFLPGLVGGYVIRKPGAALATEFLAAVLQVFLGNPSGLILALTGLIQGAGVEVVLAATGYRRWGWRVLIAAGASAAVFSFVYTYIRFNMGATFSIDTLALILALRVISGIVLCGIAAKFVAEGLWRTGVFNGLAIDAAYRSRG
jgi:energy-coupling factor transport system substrate-specific component